MATDLNLENIFNILVATDIHLGYAEKDPIRGEDSFIAFEEILILAVENKVDFLLLGGDLFHDNKPSQKCLHKCITLLRRYCMGESPVGYEFLSDQSINFGNCPFPHVNYEDANLNISLPVFSIHGNHDDPTGNWNLASLDILSASGLVNYFGCCTNLQNVEVRPLLLRKGSTHLALFGLGSMKDERLSRLLSQSKVVVFRPEVKTDEWFNLMVLHQNHVIRGTSQNSYVPETALPDFMDLIIWGHEHECIPNPIWNPNKEFFVLQPGSSVATSLSEGEAVSKHVFLLHVQGRQFKVDNIKLQTVRPFVFDNMCLSKFDSLQPDSEDQKLVFEKNKKEKISLSKKVEEHVVDHVNTMIRNAISQRSGHNKQPKLPLIRLRVEYKHNEQMFNPVRVGLNFLEQVANPDDMILLKKEVTRKGNIKEENDELDGEALLEAAENARREQGRIAEIQVETLVEKYFQDLIANDEEHESKKSKHLKVLSVKGLLEGVTRHVDKQDTDSLSEVFIHQVAKTVEHLKKEEVQGDEGIVTDALQRYRAIREQNRAKEDEEIVSHLNSKKKPGKATKGRQDIDFDDDMDVESLDVSPIKTATRGRGRARGKGKREPAYDEDDDMDVAPQKPAPRGRGRGRGGRGRSAPRNQPQISFMQKGSSNSFMESPKTASRSRHNYISSDED